MRTVHDAAGGRAGLLALARAWHARCLADPVASHPFGHGGLHPQHVERLAAYWGEALGGPPAYTDTMGDEAGVLRMHAGNGTHRELDALVVLEINRTETVELASPSLRALSAMSTVSPAFARSIATVSDPPVLALPPESV